MENSEKVENGEKVKNSEKDLEKVTPCKCEWRYKMYSCGNPHCVRPVKKCRCTRNEVFFLCPATRCINADLYCYTIKMLKQKETNV